ncbi:MAG: adenylate/guanylate cyclase domain-containing protein, partial [Alphaproteobacteria bacterium]
DEAIAALEARRDADPSRPSMMLAATYAEAGRMDEARATVKESLKRFPKFSLKRLNRFLRYKDPADKERIIVNLRKAGVPE